MSSLEEKVAEAMEKVNQGVDEEVLRIIAEFSMNTNAGFTIADHIPFHRTVDRLSKLIEPYRQEVEVLDYIARTIVIREVVRLDC